jgi:hypothetical protein
VAKKASNKLSKELSGGRSGRGLSASRSTSGKRKYKDADKLLEELLPAGWPLGTSVEISGDRKVTRDRQLRREKQPLQNGTSRPVRPGRVVHRLAGPEARLVTNHVRPKPNEIQPTAAAANQVALVVLGTDWRRPGAHAQRGAGGGQKSAERGWHGRSYHPARAAERSHRPRHQRRVLAAGEPGN